MPPPNQVYKATTILNVRKDGEVVMIGDGQISLGDTVFKGNAKKVRKITDTTMAGFAGRKRI
jgi:ATP-dependent HslUV protease subunit HslV